MDLNSAQDECSKMHKDEAFANVIIIYALECECISSHV